MPNLTRFYIGQKENSHAQRFKKELEARGLTTSVDKVNNLIYIDLINTPFSAIAKFDNSEEPDTGYHELSYQDYVIASIRTGSDSLPAKGACVCLKNIQLLPKNLKDSQEKVCSIPAEEPVAIKPATKGSPGLRRAGLFFKSLKTLPETICNFTVNIR
ncbi:hypothetical protein ACFORL_10310 [Legionella dresdenensis]|uniref:Uncharacterized protein n=1 Tax=Legionella dresdenensis TaxID=450200 RepID=A0ABV8CGK9_9GAMM